MNQDQIKEAVSAKFGPEVVLAVDDFRGQLSLTIAADKILDVCTFLKNDPELAFNFLTFVAGVDRHPNTPRIEVVYQLYSLSHNHRFRIKAKLDDAPGKPATIDSVFGIWPTADWHERETAEMFGIVFKNHPDPRKLLLPEEWKVHPLRKDFPLAGTPEDTPDLPASAR